MLTFLYLCKKAETMRNFLKITISVQICVLIALPIAWLIAVVIDPNTSPNLLLRAWAIAAAMTFCITCLVYFVIEPLANRWL